MSSTILLRIDKINRTAEWIAEYRNSWGSAPVIWTILFDKYIRTPESTKYMGWMNSDCKELWELWKDERLSTPERVALLSTFDRVVISAKNANRLYDDIMIFLRSNIIPGERVCHWSDIVREIIKDSQLYPEARYGIWHTTVSENPFVQYQDENRMLREDIEELYDDILPLVRR